MPFAGFPNFDDCVEKQMAKGRSEEEARKICGYIKSRTEGKVHVKGEDPTQAEWLISRYESSIKKLFEDLKPKLEKIIEKPKTHAASDIIRIDLKSVMNEVDNVMGKMYADAEGTIQTELSRAYSQGDSFAQIRLGAKPSVRKATWKVIGDRVLKSQSDFKGINDATAAKIKAAIANGIINEKTQGEIIDEIRDVIDKVGVARAETMVRTESMKAVNDGVKDRYDAEGVDGFERLEADDEKTCTDWEFNIDGQTYFGCAGIDGKIFTRDQANEVDEQTHPNCRGTWIPHFKLPGDDE